MRPRGGWLSYSQVLCVMDIVYGALAIILTGWLTVFYPQADWTLPC